MKLCGFYIRVSTEKQASVEEGSLKNQDHLLTQYVKMKSQFGGDQWTVVDRYVDEGISAKDTNRPAFQRMLRDIESKRVNTVVCLALSRISRSTKDLLELVEFFRHHEVDFICLKEEVDTTTAMGRLLLTFMGGLNQFEREQTGDRTRSACLARAERGLWNGGQILGYTLDSTRPGNLLINEAEAEIIRFGFKAYLECGSVLKTRDLLNQRGYKTKSYTTRRGNLHASARFSHASVHQMLTNLTYIGKRYVRSIGQKTVGADEKDRIVDAVWSPLLDSEIFYEVQNLLKQNLKTRNNGSCPTKHFYLLNAGFIYCNKCGRQMEGRNGHGHKGRKAYYYYVCKNHECRFKVPQTEAEGAIFALMSEAAKESQILPKVVEKLNRKIKELFPSLENEIRAKEQGLRGINDRARELIEKGDMLNGGRVFVQEEINRLSAQRKQTEDELALLKSKMDTRRRNEVSEEDVRKLLGNGQNVFGQQLKPFKRKELLRLVMTRCEISDKCVKIGVNHESARQSLTRSSEQDATLQPSRGAI